MVVYTGDFAQVVVSGVVLAECTDASIEINRNVGRYSKIGSQVDELTHGQINVSVNATIAWKDDTFDGLISDECLTYFDVDILCKTCAGTVIRRARASRCLANTWSMDVAPGEDVLENELNAECENFQFRDE